MIQTIYAPPIWWWFLFFADKNEVLSDVGQGGGELVTVLDVQYFFFV